MSKIKMTGKYTTRDGRAVRILAVDRKGDHPVIALVTEFNGRESIESYTYTGFYYDDHEDNHSEDDLVPVTKKTFIHVTKDAFQYVPHTHANVVLEFDSEDNLVDVRKV